MIKIIISLFFASFIACKQNIIFTGEKTDLAQQIPTNSKKIFFDDLEEVSLPFCFKIETTYIIYFK